MVFKLIGYIRDGRKIELTVTTNDVAHSIFSDFPNLRANIETAVINEIDSYVEEQNNDDAQKTSDH